LWSGIRPIDLHEGIYDGIDGVSDKDQLRKTLRQARRDHVAAQPQAIRALLFNRPPVSLVETIPANAVIGLYHATRFEAPTRGYAQFFIESGHDIALPHFADRDAEMTFRRHTDPLGESDLEPGPFGMTQPADDAPAITPDIVFAPLIGFTPDGDRIGQGGGHYDRWLTDHGDVRAIGLAWDVQCVDTLPVEGHDRRLNTIVTPTRIYAVD